MNIETKDWKAYVPYYGDNIINEYNLKESDNIKLYNIKDDIEINKLHYHYSELIAAYYVWKNQIKNDYICLWDHRRFLTPINFDKLDNDMIQVYYHGYTDLTPFEYMLKEGINEYIMYQFIKYMIEIKNIDHDEIIDKIYYKPWENRIWFHSCFNCNWKVFNDVCEFIFGFLSYIIPTHQYKDQRSCDLFIQDMQRSISILKSKCKDGEIIDFGRIESGDRDFANFFEMLLPLYCEFVGYTSFNEVEDKHIAIKLFSYNKDTVIGDIRKLIAKNIFTGCRDFAIITSNDNYNELEEILANNWYYMSNNMINLFTENNEELNKYIILETNEFIDSNSPIDNINKNNIQKLI